MKTRPALTGLLVLALTPAGCVSGTGAGGVAMVGMMGAMAMGGTMMGRGMTHSGGPEGDSTFVALFDPGHLLEQRAALELDDAQVGALEGLLLDVREGRLKADAAAQAAHDLLRPVQRAAARGLMGHRPPDAREGPVRAEGHSG